MCEGCPGHCCRLVADLTTYDIVRIAVQESLRPQDFVEFVRAKDNDAFAFRSRGELAKFVLKHKGGGCTFLKGGLRMNCSIESSKPAVCLAYPFGLAGGKPVLLRKALCPQKNLAMADHAKMSEAVLADCDWELHTYAEIVADWNRASGGNGTPEQFLAFAAREMELEKTAPGSFYRKLLRAVRSLSPGSR